MKQTLQNPKIRNGTDPDTPLWKRIRNFSLDAAGVHFPFSRKLAKENHWDTAFTTEAITEYKKFTYLCCILPQGASPPYIIDQVWHMHLIYTQNYWELFCDKILEQKLHHHPSTGGHTDQKKHENWRRDTLEQYQVIFGMAPPPHIWTSPPPQQVTGTFLRRLFPKVVIPLPLLLLLCFLPGCNGPGGIALFSFGIVALFITLIRGANRASQEQHKKQDGTIGSSSDSGGGSSCSSGCGSSCGGGCGGGCGGCGGS